MWSVPVTIISPYASHSFITMAPLCMGGRIYSKVYIKVHILMIIFFLKTAFSLFFDRHFFLQNN